MKATNILITALLLVFLTGCASPEKHAAQRRERLLAIYPLGTTTRADVHQRWGETKPELSQTRPAAGWTNCPTLAVRERCLASEQRTGKPVDSCERYWGPDGLFSLCYCWFYYDRADHLVDVDWQYHTD